MRAEAGRKDRLPHLLATISVDVKRHWFSFLEWESEEGFGALANRLAMHLPQ